MGHLFPSIYIFMSLKIVASNKAHGIFKTESKQKSGKAGKCGLNSCLEIVSIFGGAAKELWSNQELFTVNITLLYSTGWHNNVNPLHPVFPGSAPTHKCQQVGMKLEYL